MHLKRNRERPITKSTHAESKTANTLDSKNVWLSKTRPGGYIEDCPTASDGKKIKKICRKGHSKVDRFNESTGGSISPIVLEHSIRLEHQNITLYILQEGVLRMVTAAP